jgi:hypothetical protein
MSLFPFFFFLFVNTCLESWNLRIRYMMVSKSIATRSCSVATSTRINRQLLLRRTYSTSSYGTFSHYSRESYSLQASGISLGFMAMADIQFNLSDLTRLRTLIVQVIFVILEIRYTYYSIEARVLPFLFAPTSCPVSLHNYSYES